MALPLVHCFADELLIFSTPFPLLITLPHTRSDRFVWQTMGTNNYTAGSMLLASACIGLSSNTAAQVIPNELEQKPKWERTASVGLTLTQGNSDSVLVTAQALGARKWDEHELQLGAQAAYGEVEDEKNADSISGFAQYNRLFSERLYGYGRIDALHDAIADVEYRVTIGPGVGYYFLKSETTSLSAEVGPSFIFEKVGTETDEYLALRIGEKFEHKFSERARMWQMAEILPQVDDWENYIINAEIGAEASLTERLSLRAYVQDTYDNQPAPGRKRNDVKLVSALGYKF